MRTPAEAISVARDGHRPCRALPARRLAASGQEEASDRPKVARVKEDPGAPPGRGGAKQRDDQMQREVLKWVLSFSTAC